MKALFKLILFSPLFYVSAQLFAVSEHQLTGDHATLIKNYYEEASESGWLATRKGASISYRRFDKNCGNTALIIVPGWSEPKRKYAELIYDLKDKQYCIYIFDHRSQGHSSRSLANTQITHVESFDEYIGDLQAFDQQIVRSKTHKYVFILAHSMGGLISTAYVASQPEKFTGLILSAPMFQTDTDPLSENLVYWITGALISIGKSESYVPSHGDWEPKNFSDNQQTNSEVRFLVSEQILLDEKSLIVSGVSNLWLHSAIEKGRQTVIFAEQINIPVMLFQATDDSFVKPERQNEFCRINLHCEKKVIQGVKHEILMEIDSIRIDVIRQIVKFIELTPK